MRRVGEVDYSKYILPVGLLVGGYLLYKNFFSGGGVATNNNVVDQNTANTANADLAKATASGSPQTIADSTLSAIANTLNEQLQKVISSGDDDDTLKMEIRNNVISVNSAADWYKLVTLFGSRKFNTGGDFSVCSWTGLECDSLDLISALKLALDPINKNVIDSFFANQGINVII